METQNFLAIDFGAESGRLIVGSLINQKLQMEEIHRFKTQGTTIANSLRWNVIRFWEEIIEGLRKYKNKYGSKAAGIGIDSWGVSFVGLNKYDDLAYLPFHYRAELIADPMLDEFKSSIGEALIFNNTGIQFMSLNTSVHIYAMNKKYPDYRSIVKTWLMIPDYFYFLLTNVKMNEYTNASTTQLLNARKRDWDDELTQILNIKKAQFPKLMHPGQLIGTLTPQVQAQTGLDAIPVYSVATHDTGSAIVAIPRPEPNAPGELWAYLSSGTWSLLGVEIPEPVINEKIQAYNFTNEGGVDNTIRLLKNIMGLWLLQECKREWERDGDGVDYESLTKEALKVSLNQSIILPDDNRFFTPVSMIKEIQAFCSETNQAIPKTRAEIVRCIFESLACRYREAVEIIEELTGKKITALHIVGGGSKNKVLSQMTADACQIPVITGPVEATAIGNLLMQAKAAGQVKNLSEIRQIVKNSFDVERYTPQANWDTIFAKYKSLQKPKKNITT